MKLIVSQMLVINNNYYLVFAIYRSTASIHVHVGPRYFFKNVKISTA